MSFNLGSLLSGGASGYAFVKNQQGLEDERLRKKKADARADVLNNRADVAYGREEAQQSEEDALRAQLGGRQPLAAQGTTPQTTPASTIQASNLTPAAGGGLTIQPPADVTVTPLTKSTQVPISTQGITPPSQPAQSQVKSWDDKVRDYKDIESKVLSSPDGGAKFKGRLDLERQKLMGERMQELPLPDNGKIDDDYAQRYTSHFAKAAQALGAVVTPEMVSAAVQSAKKLAAENVDKAQAAAEAGDIELANKYGLDGDMRWNLSNKKQITLPNGAKVYQYDNTMPDGKVITFNTFESGKRLLDNAAKLKFILQEQNEMTQQNRVKNEAKALSIKPIPDKAPEKVPERVKLQITNINTDIKSLEAQLKDPILDAQAKQDIQDQLNAKRRKRDALSAGGDGAPNTAPSQGRFGHLFGATPAPQPKNMPPRG